MKNTENLFQLIIDNIPTRIFWKDVNSNYLGSNALFSEDAGVNSVQDLIGKNDFELAWSTSQSESFIKDDQEVLASGLPKINIEEPQRQADGEVHWLETSKIPLKNDNGETVGLLGLYRDITAKKNEKLAFERMAITDELTGIPNRYFIKQYIERISKEKSFISGLLFIDLDYFKIVNDTWGHQIGDLLLKKVAVELKKTVGDRGVVARVGGDEFCVLINTLKTNDNFRHEIEQLSQAILANFSQPFHVDEHILYLGASIGISFYQEGAVNSSVIFREADLAMYQAKLIGRNAYVFYSEKMKKRNIDENDLVMKLRNAVDKSEVHLVYQPQFDVNEECVGAEALMRWEQPDIGLVSPEQFIPIAEKAGLIHPMGSWLLDQSRKIQDVRFSSARKYCLSINISPIQFRQEGFEDLLIKKLLETNLPASMFEIEVTESLLFSNQEVAFDKLRRLREIGFSIAIDDFGTGYSSLSYLSRLPVDKLKIDRSFVSRLFEDEKNQIIVKMILHLASSLGIKTVAEGVETKEEFDFLKKHHCDYFQGYYFARPMSESQYCADF
jgi:diguanylate cyclase (GGDEF)-like protein/PAS domain S-box-containing protein